MTPAESLADQAWRAWFCRFVHWRVWRPLGHGEPWGHWCPRCERVRV